MKASKLQNKMKNKVLSLVDEQAANEREQYYEQASYKNHIVLRSGQPDNIIYEEQDYGNETHNNSQSS